MTIGSPDARRPLVLGNLLLDMAALARLLVSETRRGAWLDAYLLAVGIAWITDEHLHPDIGPLSSAAGYLSDKGATRGRIAAGAVGMIFSARRSVASMGASYRYSAAWRRDLTELVDALADAVAQQRPAGTARDLVEKATKVARDPSGLVPRLGRTLVRPPACFHELDQSPADLDSLARRFAARWPNRGRPLLVVGVRTSGSYLAPLLAAFLRARGYAGTRVLTIRPGRGLLSSEQALIRSVAGSGGLALLTDDPPVTGRSIADTARELERAGLSSDSVVLLLAVPRAADLPSSLERYDTVLLPAADWEVRRKLEPAAVERSLSDLLGSEHTVLSLTPLALPLGRPARLHVRARFRVRLRDEKEHREADSEILVEGVGLGYLGRTELAAARALSSFTPTVLGLRDGLIYREWLPHSSRVDQVEGAGEDTLASQIAAYVAARHRAFPVPEDLGLRFDEAPAWDVVSRIVSRPFGRAWPLAKVLLIDRVARRILRVDQASVVDGNTDLGHWFYRNHSRRSLVKVDAGDQLFSNLGLRCFDPAFDLAGVTARAGTISFAHKLRAAYGNLEEKIDEERVLLYELAHLWARERTEPGRKPELERARSRAVQRYFADVFYGDLEDTAGDGPLCALDVDGVLETEHLGFPALSPASAVALRALRCHGFRPIIVSGRSLGDVVDRCRAYGLAGGVAEYGAAIYDRRGDDSWDLVPREDALALEAVRAELGRADGIELDRSYHHSVRAFRTTDGRRVGLRPEWIARALQEVDRIRAVRGQGQTDFVPAGVDKGTGLRALLVRLPGPGGATADPIALAVGDTAEDRPMLRLATRARAPAHARALRGSEPFELMSRPYQAGLAQAVGKLIGHPPGRCPDCRMPRPTAERRMLLTVLGAQEMGGWRIPLQALRVASSLRERRRDGSGL